MASEVTAPSHGLSASQVEACMRPNAKWPLDAKKNVWVSEHNALRADMDDLAAAIATLDNQLAAGKALTAWQVRVCCDMLGVGFFCTPGAAGARAPSAPPASCVTNKAHRDSCEWRQRAQRECGGTERRVLPRPVSRSAADRKGRRVFLRRTPPGC